MVIGLNPKNNPMLLEGELYPAEPVFLTSYLPMIYIWINNPEILREMVVWF
jgi:hypothetical protein